MIDRNDIVTGFREFQQEGIPAVMEAYGGDHEYVIGQVFLLVKRSSKLVGGSDGMPDKMEFVFPIAKVLQVGKKWRGTGGDTLKPGDYLRLRDNECKTVLNPTWEAWKSQVNAVKDGNMEAIGEAPPMYFCNMRQVFGKRMFNPDTFNLSGRDDWFGWDTFYFDEANIVDTIVNPDLLLDEFVKQVLSITKN